MVERTWEEAEEKTRYRIIRRCCAARCAEGTGRSKDVSMHVLYLVYCPRPNELVFHPCNLAEMSNDMFIHLNHIFADKQLLTICECKSSK